MIKFVYKICPVYVKCVDGNIHGFAGFSYGPYIKINKSYKDDIGLLEHELTHSKQFYRSFGIWGLLYKISSYRYEYEFEAYSVQLSMAAEEDRERLADTFSGFLVDNYNLTLDREKTKQLLLDSLK